MKKIEMPRLDYRNVVNCQHWEAYKELFEGINETLAAGRQIFVIVTAGPFTGSIMPVTMTARFARIGITAHGYSGEFSEVYKKLMAEGGIGFNYYANGWESMVGQVGNKTFNFGEQRATERSRYAPVFLIGYEGEATLVRNGKKIA